MTGNKEMLSNIIFSDGCFVTFGDNSKGSVISKGDVSSNGTSNLPLITYVLLVKNLKHNLLSISQLCDKGFNITFSKNKCNVFDKNHNTIFEGIRDKNIYILNMNVNNDSNLCLVAKENDSCLCHIRFCHINFNTINKLAKNKLVKGLLNIKFKTNIFCDACKLGKLTKSSFKLKKVISTEKPLELLHMDLFGPTQVQSINHNRYVFVIVDDFSRYTWIFFLKNKSDTFDNFKVFVKRIQNIKTLKIKNIRSDHGGEFENEVFEQFCNKKGINHNFSFPRTPQQNGVVERKNRTLQECARTLLNGTTLSKYFWAEAVATACYVLNRVSIRPLTKNTPYELINGRKPNISYFKVFDSKCFLLNTKDNLSKFDPKSDEGIHWIF